MIKKRLSLDWSIKAQMEDYKPALLRFRKYLVDNGFQKFHDRAAGMFRRRSPHSMAESPNLETY